MRRCEQCGHRHGGRGRFCGAACRTRAWKVRTDYRDRRSVRNASERVRRASRDGRGVRLYLTPEEARELATMRLGQLSPGLRRKLRALLRRV